ncbi:MAG: hypothetical protein K2L82_00555 [Lachnospiraceae bacterium]|nr:hypothetical protein [Lachnospiraceae bacterium]
MLSVIVIWIYMFFTTFPIGYGIMCVAMRGTQYRVKHMDTYLICGLAGVTVYAQFASLIGPVGLTANLILCVIDLIIVWVCRRAFVSALREVWNNIWENQSGERGRMFIILFLFLLFAYGTSRGIIHYDTSLYHAQSIRWLEEYGVVKGLGNLHCRLAYNSSSFALSALYSMAFLGGQSYHCAAGWLAFLIAKVCAEIIALPYQRKIRFGGLQLKRLRTSDFARAMGIYYLVNIFDEMVSPASDYFMVLIALYIVIRWLELLEESVAEILPYAMLCVLGVFLMTVKLSAAFILLLVIHPAYYLLRSKRWKEIVKYLILGMVTALPYFVRNVLLSGWLVYPFTQIDLFDAAWKIPKGVAEYDAKEIQVWGRGYSDVNRYDISVSEWMPEWFKSLAGSDKLFVLAAVMSVCILLVYAVGMLCRLWKGRRDVLLVQITVAASFGFWLCTSPLIRYGCVYVYLTPAIILGGAYDELLSVLEKRKKPDGAQMSDSERRENERNRAACKTMMGIKAFEWCGTAAVLLLLLYKCAALGREIVVSHQNDYWIVQKDYENYDTKSYQIQGVDFYYPVQGDQVGYDSFPSAPVKTEVRFLGQNIGEGFAAGN